jgi:hypothetical protein
MSIRRAIVNAQTGLVENVILLADGVNWQPPAGCSMITSDGAGIGDTWNGKAFIKPEPPPQEPPPPPEPPTQAQLLAYAADKRYQVETGGIVLPGPIAIDTSRESQAKLMAAYVRAKADPSYAITNWKVSSGVFVPLNAAVIIGIGSAVTAHVQACFTIEAAVSAGVLAGQITDYAGVEAANWPSNG